MIDLCQFISKKINNRKVGVFLDDFNLIETKPKEGVYNFIKCYNDHFNNF